MTLYPPPAYLGIPTWASERPSECHATMDAVLLTGLTSVNPCLQLARPIALYICYIAPDESPSHTALAGGEAGKGKVDGESAVYFGNPRSGPPPVSTSKC